MAVPCWLHWGVVSLELNWEHEVQNRQEASKGPPPLSAMPFDRACACCLVLLYPLDTEKSVAFAGPSAAQDWSALSEVPASVPLVWAGTAVKTAELYSPKKAFTYQECEPKR